MPAMPELLAWARKHAEDLKLDMRATKDLTGNPLWVSSDDPEAEPRITGRAVRALDFLDRYAGRDSQWSVRAHAVFDSENERVATRARTISNILSEWASQVGDGLAPIAQAEAQGARAIASTDLMEQVRMLNEDRNVHPAAPIVLAGAAIEIALRSAIEELGLATPPKHSIDAYMGCLRGADMLTRQDVKDITQMAGMRNSAAHGEHDELSRERAGLMEQQVNMFLRRLAELVETHAATEAQV